MVRQITKDDFLARVKITKCKGQIIEGGRAKDGHSDCQFCQGNYFVGGECNYGGSHTIENDLEILNRNFDKFSSLSSNQDAIYQAVSEEDFNKSREKLLDDFGYLKRKCEASELDYFKGTCIQVDGHQEQFLELIKTSFRTLFHTLERYVEKIQKLDYWQIKDYREKRNKLDEMQKEANQLMSDYKEAVQRGDTVEASRLMALYNQKKQTMGELMRELKKNPIDDVLGDEAKNFFDNIIQNIFQGDTDFFNEPEKKNQTGKKIWGFIPQKYWGKVKWGGIIIAILSIIFLFYRWIRSKM